MLNAWPSPSTHAAFDLVASRAEAVFSAFNTLPRGEVEQILSQALQQTAFQELADKPDKQTLGRGMENKAIDPWWQGLTVELCAQLRHAPCVICEPCSLRFCEYRILCRALAGVLLRGTSQQLLSTEVVAQ